MYKSTATTVQDVECDVGGWQLCTSLQLQLYKMLSVMWVVGSCVQVYSYNCTRC